MFVCVGRLFVLGFGLLVGAQKKQTTNTHTQHTHTTNTNTQQMVVEKDGVAGLFGRGLRTKLIANGMQGIMFSVLWRLGQDAMAAKEKKDNAENDAAAAGKKK